MPGNMRAQPLVVTSYGGNTMQTDEEIQFAPSSRPVSFYDNFKDVRTMPPCVTSAMSVGNLSEARDKSAGVTISMPNNNNNNRVSSAVSTGNVSKIQSSKVMAGAVSTGNIGKIGRGDRDRELGRAPSMANCLSTTVPVNLAASQIAGRHTPTRNSLRHSRMIVLHRSGHRPQKFLPPLVYRKRLGRCLAALQTILGVAVTSLSLWLLLWAPHLPVVDNPYWSGMPLLLSGSFGICLLCCFKKEYPGMGPGFCLSSTKVISASLALLSTVASTAACVFSVMHLVRLMGVDCTPARVLNAACVCRPRVEVANNSTATVVRYVDLNCPEVESILTILLIFSATCNALGALVSGWYTYLHWSTRNKRPKYIQVRTSPHGNHYPTTRPIYNPHMGER